MESVMKEASAFIDYLRVCTGAFPNTTDDLRGYSSDQANAPVISYPFKLTATLYPETGNHDYTVVILNKLSSDAPWRIEDAWKATLEGKRTGEAAIPTNASQDKGNKKLPSLMVKGARINCP
jgi:FlaG/FlaF family flagellin (archaellin)